VPAGIGIAAGVSAAVSAFGGATPSGEESAGARGGEPLTEFPYPPGSDQWTEADKSGDCWGYASQRSGGRLRNCPDGYARSLPEAYPPEKKVTLSGTEQDLRDYVEPGMAMVWQPRAEGGGYMYGVNNSPSGDDFTPPSSGEYYDDVRWAPSGGHVAIVEEVGPDYIWVSDQYGRHRIDREVRYMRWPDNPDTGKCESDLLTGPTFIDLT
jgi:hypothetical protein